MRLECPHCQTSYEAAYCGIPTLELLQRAAITTVCMVCKKDFDVTVTPTPGVTPGWFARTVLRRPVVAAGHSVVSSARG